MDTYSDGSVRSFFFLSFSRFKMIQSFFRINWHGNVCALSLLLFVYIVMWCEQFKIARNVCRQITSHFIYTPMCLFHRINVYSTYRIWGAINTAHHIYTNVHECVCACVVYIYVCINCTANKSIIIWTECVYTQLYANANKLRTNEFKSIFRFDDWLLWLPIKFPSVSYSLYSISA